jgi:hypothetical protein
MNINWKVNRFTLFALFLYTAFYTLINPKPAIRITDVYAKGLMAETKDDAEEDLSK